MCRALTYWNAGVAEPSSVYRQPVVERLGVGVDGLDGKIAVSPSSKLSTGLMILHLLALPWCRVRNMLKLLGRLVYAFEYRRPLMGHFNVLWETFGGQEQAQFLSTQCVAELLLPLISLPIACADLRLITDGDVSCTDACETGGGACVSSSITTKGIAMLDNIRYRRSLPELHAPQVSIRLRSHTTIEYCWFPSSAALRLPGLHSKRSKRQYC